MERSSVKIEIESSEEMEHSQGGDFGSKHFKTGQSSKGIKRGRKGMRRKTQEQRGRGRPRQPTNTEEGTQAQRGQKRGKKSLSMAVHEAE